MAAKFRKVDPRFWNDEKVRQLDSDGKLLALWLLTSSRVNRCGIVLWSAGLASEETGIQRDRIETVLDTVCHTLPWQYDQGIGVVFLVHWWRYNRPDNKKALLGALCDLHDVPRSNVLEFLVQSRKELPQSLWETLDTVCHRVSDTVSSQEKEQEKEKEKEQEQEQEQDKRADAHGANGRVSASDVFDLWNRTATTIGLNGARDLTDERLKKIRTRMKKPKWLANFQSACELLPLPGPDGSWQPDFDWMVENETNVCRIIEGKYNWRAKKAPPQGEFGRNQAVLDRMMEFYADGSSSENEEEVFDGTVN